MILFRKASSPSHRRDPVLFDDVLRQPNVYDSRSTVHSNHAVEQRSEEERARRAPQESWTFKYGMNPSEREELFGAPSECQWKETLGAGTRICNLLLDWTEKSPFHDVIVEQ